MKNFSLSRKAAYTALLLVLLLITAPISFSNPNPDLSSAQGQQRSPRPFPPTQYIPNRDYDTKHIALDLHFDWEKEQAIGQASITLAPLVDDLQRVEFDAANMTVTSVRMASGVNLKFETDREKQKLWITLDRGYPLGASLTLAIDYHTDGSDIKIIGLTGGGLRFIKPSAEDPKRPRQIWSQGESEYNHFWFPCYDHPNDFFTSEITATVEKPLSVISNGKLLETKENNNGTRTFHWKIDQPHASYLTSIIVGEYEPIVQDYAGIPVITNVYPAEVNEGRVTAARLAEMVKFFSEKTGLRYPYAKYAQTMARDFGGGMENISATTQTDNMIHDARTEIDQTSDSLQSHELAHQWFGDYVTARSWSDIWLNESFATYFQAMWDEHHLGHDDFLYLDVKSNQDQYYNAWRQGNRRPIVTRNYSNPDAVFDTYAYPRGGAVLHMLRTFLGEDNWWRAISYYLHKYANQPVETEQFRIAIEESTGQPMDWFFDEWLYRMGHPMFEITKAYDQSAGKLTLTVKQTQKPDPDSQYPQVKFFQTPVDIELVTDRGSRIQRVQIEPKEEQTFTFALDAEPKIVNFDYGNTIIKQVEFKKSTDELLHQVAKDKDVMGRMWALGQLTDIMQKEGTATAERDKTAAQLADTVSHDGFWAMRLESAAALKGGGKISKEALIAATRDENAKVRAQAINSLAASKDSSLDSLYAQFLSDKSYAVIRAAALALGQTKSSDAYTALVKLIDVPSWRDNIRASALSGLAAAADKRALEIGVKFSTKENLSAVRGAALRILGNAGKDDSGAFELISTALGEAAEKRDFGLLAAAADALATLGDPRGLVVFEDLLKKNNNSSQLRGFLSPFQNRLRQALPASTTARP